MRVEIDPALCIGSSNCMEEAPEAFEVDEHGLAVLRDTHASAEAVLAGARACPMDAIRVFDDHGRRLHP